MIKNLQNPFFSSASDELTKSIWDFGRINLVFFILYRVYDSIIYGIGLGAASLEMDMTQPSQHVSTEFSNPDSMCIARERRHILSKVCTSLVITPESWGWQM